MNVLETNDGAGKDGLKTVKGAAKTIGKRAAGQGGAYSREIIEDYLDAIAGAERDLREIGEKQNAVDVAVSKLHTVTLTKEKKEQERAVAAKAGEVAEEETWIAEQKKYVNLAIDLTTRLVNPTDWVGIAVEAGVFIAKETVDSHLSTDNLGRLQEELAGAKARLRGIEDRAIMSEIRTASLDLDRARMDLANGKKDFLANFEKIRRKEATVVEHLGQSKETEGAAAALEERGIVGAVAVNTEFLISHYLSESTEFMRRLTLLDDMYLQVLLAVDSAPELVSRGPAHAAHLASVAETNRTRLDELKGWMVDSREQAHERKAYIGNGAFFAGYDAMPAALGGALRDRNERPRKP
jgi:hypothetical protein